MTIKQDADRNSPGRSPYLAAVVLATLPIWFPILVALELVLGKERVRNFVCQSIRSRTSDSYQHSRERAPIQDEIQRGEQ